MNIDTPLAKQCYDLSLAIAKLPASPRQTRLSYAALLLGDQLSAYEHGETEAATSVEMVAANMERLWRSSN